MKDAINLTVLPRDHGIEATFEHYACMVTLFGHAEKLMRHLT